MHVAVSTIDKLVDYVMNTPEDGLRSALSVKTLSEVIRKNKDFLYAGEESVIQAD